MKITEKGFYKTRGGNVVFVYEVSIWRAFGAHISGVCRAWNVDTGRFNHKRECELDLVKLIKPYSEIEKEIVNE